jgi:uncharacterized protein YndB with AHSA1/START domain
MSEPQPPSPYEHKGRVTRAEIVTSAPPDRVWEAWTDPDRLAEWFVDRARGRVRTGATVTWFFDRFKSSIDFAVLAADTPRHLIMRAGAPDGRSFVQEIGIEREGTGSRVSAAGSGMSCDDEEHEGMVSGWEMALGILKHYLENHFGEPRRSFFAMQPAPVEYDRIRKFFSEGWYMGQWLTSTGSIGEVGEAYRLELRGGDTMSGVVLAKTSREVALSWEEINGFVELKAFRLGGPGERAVCMRGSGWDMSSELRLEIERMANVFVNKLVAALKEPTQSRAGNGHGAPH